MDQARIIDRFRQTALYAAALAMAKLMSFVLVPVYTAWLTPTDYGRLDVLQTMANLLTLLVGMGMSDTLFRFAGSAKDARERDRVSADILGIALVMCLIFHLFFQGIAPVVATFLPGGVSETETRLMLGSIGFTGTIMVPLAWLRLRDNALAYFLSYTGWMGLMAVLSSLLLMLGQGVTGVMWSIFIAHLVMSCLLVGIQIRRSGIRLVMSGWTPYIRFGSPLILTGLAGFVMGSFDRWILADVVSTAVLAEYVLAAKVAMLVALVAEPFDLWWLPRRFRIIRQSGGKEQAAATISQGLLLAMASCIFMAGAGPFVIFLLTPEAYHGAMIYVPWMGFLVAMGVFARFLNMGCHAGPTTTRLFQIDAMAAVIATIGYFQFIPGYGIQGTILATAFALVFRLTLITWFSQRQLPLPFDWKSLGILSGWSLAMVIWINQVDNHILSILLSGAGLLILGGLASFCDILKFGSLFKSLARLMAGRLS